MANLPQNVTTKRNELGMMEDHFTQRNADGVLEISGCNNQQGKTGLLAVVMKDNNGRAKMSLTITESGGIKVTEYDQNGVAKPPIDLNDKRIAGDIIKQWEASKTDLNIAPKELAALESKVLGAITAADNEKAAQTNVARSGLGESASKMMNGKNIMVQVGDDNSKHITPGRNEKAYSVAVGNTSVVAHANGYIDVNGKSVQNPELAEQIKVALKTALMDGKMSDKEFQTMAGLAQQAVQVANGTQVAATQQQGPQGAVAKGGRV